MSYLISDYRSDPVLFNKDGRPIPLQGMYANRSAFLICGGPSLKELDLSLLSQRGVLSMTVNNTASMVRSQLWCCVDSPTRWISQIWEDPAIMKFVPQQHFGHRTRKRNAEGKIVHADVVSAYPNVFGYQRNARFEPSRFLTETSFNWGCGNTIPDHDGTKGTRTVMLVAIKMLFYLGVRTIYLIGCDWSMNREHSYAFPTGRHDAVGHNNNLYRITGRRLAALRPYLEQAGLLVFNCTPGSKLTAFRTMSYERAIDLSTRLGNIDTRGFYS